jgi:hypothetical protein
MTLQYPNPALEAELAYRREQLSGGRRTGGSVRRHWARGRRRAA